MAVSASARDRFYRKIESLLGPDDAAFLMDALPPGGWAEVATKVELRELGSGLRGEMAVLGSGLRGETAVLGSELRTEMGELRSELRTEMAALGSELRTEMAVLGSELRTEMAELGSGLLVEMAGIRAGMVTKADLGELLRLHVDGRVGAISRWWMATTVAMQAVTIGGIVAAIRL